MIRSILYRDTRNAVGLLAVALLLGWGVNALRTPPLPFLYVSKENRLRTATSQIQPFFSAPKSDAAILAMEIEQVRAISERRHPGLLIDARASVFHEMGHIPASVNLSRKEFQEDYLRLQESLKAYQASPVVVYCSGADCEDSRLVAQALRDLSFEKVYLFEGGWEEWEEAGYPASTEATRSR